MPIKREKLSSMFAWFFSGILVSTSGLSGPPITIFLINQKWEKLDFRNNLALYFSIIDTVTVLSLFASGFITRETLVANLFLIPSVLIGYFIGILTSYYFGRLWVFKVDNNFTLSEIIRFVSVYVIGGLGMTIIIFCLDYYLNLDYRLSWIVGALFAITNNYLGSKHLVFSKKDI